MQGNLKPVPSGGEQGAILISWVDTLDPDPSLCFISISYLGFEGFRFEMSYKPARAWCQRSMALGALQGLSETPQRRNETQPPDRFSVSLRFRI